MTLPVDRVTTRRRHQPVLEPVMVVRAGLVILVTFFLQLSVVSTITIFGARGDLMLLVAIAAGIVGGPDRGAVVGFASGFVYDLALNGTPLGLSALVYCVVGYLVGAVHLSVLRSSGWIPIANAMVASAAGVVAYALIGELLGLATLSGTPLPIIVVVVSVLNGLLARPWVWAMNWALASDADDRAFRP